MRSAEHDARPLASHMFIVWDMRLMMMMRAGRQARLVRVRGDVFWFKREGLHAGWRSFLVLSFMSLVRFVEAILLRFRATVSRSLI